ncbi:MAG: PKD domain-containing protein, partial [Paludibacteraceae bacterium]|nr:PKD domain-containing protein [Paludibacteraceae bacterium]
PLSSFTVNWYDSNFNLIGSDYTLRNVPAGDYYVELNRDQCSAQRKVRLTAVDGRDNSGLSMTVYSIPSQSTSGGSSNQDTLDCNLTRVVSHVSSLSADVSTIDAKYVVWSGYVTPPCSGNYLFHFNGGNLFVNNNMVPNDGSISLQEGASYMIAYLLERNNTNANVEVKWTTPCSSNGEESIPSCALTAGLLDGIGSLFTEHSDITSLSAYQNCLKDTCLEPVVNLSPLRQICGAGASVTLDAFVPGATYMWKKSDNDGVLSTQASLTVSAPGYYTVEVTSWCGKKVQKDVVVQRLSPKEISVTASTDAACYGSSVRLRATGGVSYQWSPSTGLSDATSATPTLTAENSNTYTVKIRTVGGCEISKSVEVKVKEPFDFDVIQKYDECNGSKIQMSAEGADEYYWYPSDGLSCIRCSVTDVVLGSDSMIYTVEGMKDGCVLKKKVTVSPLLKQSDLDFTPDSINTCGATFTASDMGQRVSYHWSVEANPSLDAEGQSVTLYFPSNGDYKVTLTARRMDCDENSVVSLTKIVRVRGCNPCNPCVVEH